MVIFLLKINPPPHLRRELVDILRSVTGPISIQPGCLACEVYESSGEDDTVLYFEHWQSMADMQNHIQSSIYSRMLTAMELSRVQPEMGFYKVSQVWGMELIESLRVPGTPQA